MPLKVMVLGAVKSEKCGKCMKRESVWTRSQSVDVDTISAPWAGEQVIRQPVHLSALLCWLWWSSDCVAMTIVAISRRPPATNGHNNANDSMTSHSSYIPFQWILWLFSVLLTVDFLVNWWLIRLFNWIYALNYSLQCRKELVETCWISRD